jgi:hypothetical protein
VVSFGIFFDLAGVNRSIQLDRESRESTVEIDDESGDQLLTAEV